MINNNNNIRLKYPINELAKKIIYIYIDLYNNLKLSNYYISNYKRKRKW